MSTVKWLDYEFRLETGYDGEPQWNAYRYDGPSDWCDRATELRVTSAATPDDLRLAIIARQERAVLREEQRLLELRGEPFAMVGQPTKPPTVLREIQSAAAEVIAEWDNTGELSSVTLGRLRNCLR